MITITGTNVTIMVKDMDASIAFYESIGLSLRQRWDSHYAMMETVGLTIGIHPGGDQSSSSGTVSIGLMITDIDPARSLLDTHHITYEEQDGGSGHYLHFRDPDGTIVYYVLPK